MLVGVLMKKNIKSIIKISIALLIIILCVLYYNKMNENSIVEIANHLKKLL